MIKLKWAVSVLCIAMLFLLSLIGTSSAWWVRPEVGSAYGIYLIYDTSLTYLGVIFGEYKSPSSNDARGFRFSNAGGLEYNEAGSWVDLEAAFGDMLKSTYDTNADGEVDSAAALSGTITESQISDLDHTDPNAIHDTDLDTFSELQDQIADKTLVNEEDNADFDGDVSIAGQLLACTSSICSRFWGPYKANSTMESNGEFQIVHDLSDYGINQAMAAIYATTVHYLPGITAANMANAAAHYRIVVNESGEYDFEAPGGATKYIPFEMRIGTPVTNLGVVDFRQGFDATNWHSYAKRVALSGSNTTSILYLPVQLPADFASFYAGTNIYINVLSSDRANNTITMSIIDDTGDVDDGVNDADIEPGSDATWAEASDQLTETDGNYASDWVYIMVTVNLDSADYYYIGEGYILYTTN
jgi:predicted lipoprotein with Yx(FWY)xxD motif